MKIILNILFVLVVFVSCSSNKEMKITIENSCSFDRLADLVEIPVDSIKDKVILKDSLVYVVKNSEGVIIPSQITYDRKLIFQPEMKANESKVFTITLDTMQTYPTKTFGRLISERKDDFAWENDRVAFRIYGQALVATDGPSNGLDIWYKRTNNLVVNNWYANDLAGVASYHNDNGEGLDDYKVGRSLGAGAMAPYVNGQLVLNENFVSEEVLDNGPLRTTFKLGYKDLDINGRKVSESRTFSIDAGSQLTKVVQAYGITEPMGVAAGIVDRENVNSTATIVSKDGYIIYSEPGTGRVDGIYLAMVFPAGIEESTTNTYEVGTTKYSHVLAITTQQPKKPVIYYTGYGWSKFGFPTVSNFETYVKNFAEGLKQPLVVKYK